jgi:hypothetical protein
MSCVRTNRTGCGTMLRRPRRLSPELAIRKADRLSVTACCEAPHARLAFEVRKRVDPHSEHARDASVHSSRATGWLTAYGK